ncbi:MAG: OmpA/MotB domain-containing protein [Bacteroidetes bacterium OLB9]|nr:MAG: OmpA/MotB domain-containing protein [Bacteroidetes bacterium OLB9]
MTNNFAIYYNTLFLSDNFLILKKITLTFRPFTYTFKPTIRMRNFLIVVILLLFLILGWLFYKDHKTCCSGENGTSAAVSVQVEQQRTGPLLFKPNDSTPILGESWPAMRDSLLRLAANGDTLEITGWYFPNSSPPETEDIGRARANAIRALFPEIPNDRVKISIKAAQYDGTNGEAVEAASFSFRAKTSGVIETDDMATIYFPYNSDAKLNNAEVETYLDKVAQRVKASGEKIQLTGHTDDVGPDDTNMRLGQRRADIIKQYLLSKGVPASQIMADSKGESAPIGDNTSEEGRAKNRRTELRIIH